ncbi:hypothetical protein TNCT_655021 [Trichonephila clavata]|uniref:Uncharacterized protein n=1 Tax=Trichonephila clavata TaxID=2740835 RepID=A0A8X6JBW4_TRICU|nr:hypothetical protein TNCT_655021 [Trichonephila clavata]
MPLALSNSSSVHRLSPSMSFSMTARAKSVSTLSGYLEICSHNWLAHVLAETFISAMLLFGMVKHYSQGLPQIPCDIPSLFSLGERLF